MERYKPSSFRRGYLIFLNIMSFIVFWASWVFFSELFGIILLSNFDLITKHYASNPLGVILFMIGYMITSMILATMVGGRFYKMFSGFFK